MSPTQAEIEARGHPVWAEIDLAHLRHNVGVLRERAAGAEVMGVVKGYAYGHGNPQSAIAMLQGGATRLGVARVAEAIHLREAGITAPIHVLTEPPPAAAPLLIQHDLTPTVYTKHFARTLADAASPFGRQVPIHVKFDTGMHRVGLQPEDAEDFVATLRSLPSLDVEGVWSHLAVADEPEHPFNKQQLERFEEVLEKLAALGVTPRLRHLANSAATLWMEDGRFDLVRCGIATYGLWPGRDLVGAADLRPVMAFRARVNLTKEVAAGEALSYGLRYELKERANIVTVPVGYADGYDRRLSGLADVIVDGTRHRVSGTVCMDQFLVDVGSRSVEVGSTVTLIGGDGDERITAEELAEQVGTINYEITTRIPSRVPRIFLDEEPG
jgi:alanine racemase